MNLKTTVPAAFQTRRLRLLSGLILGLFLLMHFTNIALGLVSVAAMDATWSWLTGPWSNPLGAVLLYGALLVHLGLTLRALYDRRTLAMSWRESLQVSFGLLFPFLLVAHVVGTEIVPLVSGHAENFAHVVLLLWVTVPQSGGRQILALLVGWSHGCFGLWYWLRFKSWYSRAVPFLFAATLLVPLLATLGFIEAGRDVARHPPSLAPVNPAIIELADRVGAGLYLALGAAIGAVLLARGIRSWRGRRSSIRISYPDGRSVAVPAGSTVLDASRLGRVPHLSVCGGRGRCSTCRVRITGGLQHARPPDAAERATLARFKADPSIRLACQLRPTGDLSVMHVLRANPPAGALAGPDIAVPAGGIEREIAVLFCDLRGFTSRAERSLPYDTVFILNRYFEIVGAAVERSGGYLDKFIGDGALALFGLDVDLQKACQQALDAAVLIARGLDDLNAHLKADLNEPLRIAMGLHAGPAIVGEMGYNRTVSLTAVGDSINVASRLEGAAKEFDVQAVISTALLAGLDELLPFERRSISVRGRSTPVRALLVPNARLLQRDHAVTSG